MALTGSVGCSLSPGVAPGCHGKIVAREASGLKPFCGGTSQVRSPEKVRTVHWKYKGVYAALLASADVNAWIFACAIPSILRLAEGLQCRAALLFYVYVRRPGRR